MTSERAQTILEDLERTLLRFIHKHKITHDEYRCATDILVATVKAGEGSLLYDVFFEAEATDIGSVGGRGSVEAIEGPFYVPNAPELEAPYALPQRADEPGDVLFFHGRVTTSDGMALAGVELDMWQPRYDFILAPRQRRGYSPKSIRTYATYFANPGSISRLS